jgi:hypothetical protein
MSATTARQRLAAAPFEIVEQTQHWRRIDGRWYRDVVVLVDGRRRLYGIPDAA